MMRIVQKDLYHISWEVQDVRLPKAFWAVIDKVSKLSRIVIMAQEIPRRRIP